VNYPALFADNREDPPGFKDEPGYNFTLLNTSPMVDAGTFLAHAPSDGNGVTIQVDDAVILLTVLVLRAPMAISSGWKDKQKRRR